MKWLLILTIITLPDQISAFRPAVDSKMREVVSLKQCNDIGRAHQIAMEGATKPTKYTVVWSCTELKS